VSGIIPTFSKVRPRLLIKSKILPKILAFEVTKNKEYTAPVGPAPDLGTRNIPLKKKVLFPSDSAQITNGSDIIKPLNLAQQMES
jgi:hypothetical protein